MSDRASLLSWHRRGSIPNSFLYIGSRKGCCISADDRAGNRDLPRKLVEGQIRLIVQKSQVLHFIRDYGIICMGYFQVPEGASEFTDFTRDRYSKSLATDFKSLNWIVEYRGESNISGIFLTLFR